MISEAYAAGFFDGEGHITIANYRRGKSGHNRRKTGFLLIVAVTNTDLPILEEYQERWGGLVYRIKTYSVTAKECWQWRVLSRHAVDFLRDILPYLKQKRPQAELAFAFQATMGLTRKPVADDVITSRAQMCQEMKRLKHVDARPGGH